MEWGKTWEQINAVREIHESGALKITFGIANHPQKMQWLYARWFAYSFFLHLSFSVFRLIISRYRSLYSGTRTDRWAVCCQYTHTHTPYAFGHTMFMVIKTSAILIKWHIRCHIQAYFAFRSFCWRHRCFHIAKLYCYLCPEFINAHWNEKKSY